jgi:hypothetical protein
MSEQWQPQPQIPMVQELQEMLMVMEQLATQKKNEVEQVLAELKTALGDVE